MNFGVLVGMSKSPANAYLKKHERGTETESMKLGSAAHCLILEGEDEFNLRYHIMDRHYDMRKKVDKAEVAEIKQQNPHKTILKQEMGSNIWQMKYAIEESSDFMDMLTTGEAEKPLYWSEQGIECKGLVDFYNHGSRIGFDLKTTDNLSSFYSKARGFYYDVQASHYIAGLEANAMFVESYYLVGIETKEPYNLEIFEITKEQVAESNELRLQWLKEWDYYTKMNYYPASQKRSTLVIDRSNELKGV
jgi:hypothetical protein